MRVGPAQINSLVPLNPVGCGYQATVNPVILLFYMVVGTWWTY